MNITVNMEWLLSVLLLSLRLTPLFLLTPILSVSKVPGRILVLWVLILSAVLVPNSNIGIIPMNPSVVDLIHAGLYELLIGMAYAFGLFTLFGAFHLGGRVVDVQMGFGVATLIDPATQNQAPLIGTFLNMVAVIVFVIVGGLDYLIKAMAFSIQHFPVGQGFSEISLDKIVSQFGLMFIYSVMVVAPAMIAILLLDVGLGVMARTMPQVNVFIISFPLKIFLGLVMLMLSFRYMMPVMNNMFEESFYFLQTVLKN